MIDYERLFAFCLEVSEDTDLLPIYSDYAEDCGIFKEELLTEVTTCLADWFWFNWRKCLFCPLQQVKLTDKQPFRISTEHVSWANWEQYREDEEYGKDTSGLPCCLLRYFPGLYVMSKTNNLVVADGWLVKFETVEEALSCVSQALIHWAQDKVRQYYLNIHLVC